MKLKKYASAAAIMPFIIIGIPLVILVVAFVTKNDEGRKLLEKVKEIIPADIVPPKTA